MNLNPLRRRRNDVLATTVTSILQLMTLLGLLFPSQSWTTTRRILSRRTLLSAGTRGPFLPRTTMRSSSFSTGLCSRKRPPGAFASFTSTTSSSSRTEIRCSSSSSSRIPSSSDPTQPLSFNWREIPELQPKTLQFHTWKVPNRYIPKLLRHPLAQPYLLYSNNNNNSSSSTTMEDSLRYRLKLVQEYNHTTTTTTANNSETMDNPQEYKLILLKNPPVSTKNDSAIMYYPSELQEELDRYGVQPGPIYSRTFTYQDYTASFVLQQVLASQTTAPPPPTAFEIIGHVAHLNLKDYHLPYKYIIGEILLECGSSSQIETVICKDGQVGGPYRTYDFEIVAGRKDTFVQMVESGIRLQFDLSKVYWCSRLSEERQRFIRKENQIIQRNQIVADPFSGVGALCILAAAKLNCTIWANDWNPDAIEYLRQNAEANRVLSKLERIQCGDAYDFLIDLGLGDSELPHHVVMNYPLEAPSFLGALRWWNVDGSRVPRVHVYTFAKAEDDGRSAEDVAIDWIAENLLPQLDDTVMTHRRSELDEEYGCHVSIHHVRDVAPGKKVYCVSFSATPKLIRVMQGDFD